MRWLPLTLSLLLTSCLPSRVSVEGRACELTSDCGEGYACFRQACVVAGSVDVLSLEGATLQGQGADEGGVDLIESGLRRAPSVFGFSAWSEGLPLPSPRQSHTLISTGSALVMVGGIQNAQTLAEVWSLRPGTDAAWQSSTALPSPRRDHATCFSGGFLYVLGGSGADGSRLAEVLRAPLRADGSLGPWSSSTPLPSGRTALAAVASGGVLYALGGESDVGLSTEVLAADLHGDGSVGTWKTVARLEGGRAHHGAAVYGSSLYVVGGSCGAPPCSPLRARTQANGSLGSWSVLPLLPSERLAASLIAGQGGLYVVGGRGPDGTLLTQVLGAAFTGSGGIESWRTLPRLPVARADAAGVLLQGVMHWVGGLASTGPVATHLEATLATGTLEPWTVARQLPTARMGVGLVAHGGNLYAVGGQPASTSAAVNTVDRAPINADGSLGTWTRAGTLIKSISQPGTVAYQGRLYVVGGQGAAGGGDSVNDVQMATFQADGSLSAFQSMTALPGASRTGAATVAFNGRLYVAGGLSGYSASLTQVLVASLNPQTGAVGTWTPTAALPGPLIGAVALAASGNVYIAGGASSLFGGYSKKVLRATLSASGLVEAWTEMAPLLEERRGLAGAVWGSQLYVMGGCNDLRGGSYCGTMLDRVERAEILADGSLSPWLPMETLDHPREALSAAAWDGRLFTAGGYDGNAARTVEQTRINGVATLGPWTPLTALPSARTSFVALASGSHVFVAGGSGTERTVLRATLSEEGSLSAWTEQEALPQDLSQRAGVAVDAHLYLSGGQEAAGQPSAEVVSSQVSAQGLSEWSSDSALPIPLSAHAMAGTPGALYVVGGKGSSAVYRAPRKTDGTLGEWEATTALPAEREGHQALVYGGYLYVLGGQSAGVAQAEVLAAPLLANGDLGAWKKISSLPSPRMAFAAVAESGHLYVMGGETSLSDVWVAPFRADGELGAWGASAPLASPLAAHQALAVQGQLLVLGGRASAPVTDVRSASLLSPKAQGTWTLRLDLGNPLSSVESLALHGAITATGRFALSARAAGADGVWSSATPFTSVSAGAQLPLDFSQTRSLWLSLQLDDGSAAREGAPSLLRDLQKLELTFKP